MNLYPSRVSPDSASSKALTLGYGVVVLLGLLLLGVKRMQKDPKAFEVLRSLVLFTKIVLPAVSQIVAKAFECSEFDGRDFRYLAADLSISEESHQ